jgi:hypothetical protein
MSQDVAEQIDARIRRQAEASVAFYAQRLDQVQRRLDELDDEWNVDRSVMTNAGILTLAGLTLSVFSRRFLLLPLVAAGFLLQYATQEWCPPVALLRRMGVRTTEEINRERYALKAVRGDFDTVNSASDEDAVARAGKAVRAAGGNAT